MGTTAWRNGGQASPVGGGWENSAANVLTADGDDLNHDGGLNPASVDVSDFGFSSGDIPVGNMISGIEVQAYFYDNNNSATLADGTIQLLNGGSLVGVNKARGPDAQNRWLGFSLAWYRPYGGNQDSWGTTLDTSWIFSSGLGVRVGFTPVGYGGRGAIKHVQMRLHYAEPVQRDFYVKHNGIWKDVEQLLVKHNGIWKDCQLFVRHNGIWKKVYGAL